MDDGYVHCLDSGAHLCQHFSYGKFICSLSLVNYPLINDQTKNLGGAEVKNLPANAEDTEDAGLTIISSVSASCFPAYSSPVIVCLAS